MNCLQELKILKTLKIVIFNKKGVLNVMKKIFSVLLISAVLITGMAVFAEDEATPTPVAATEATVVTSEADTATAAPTAAPRITLRERLGTNAAAADIKLLKDQITANQETISGLRADARVAFMEAKARIKALMADFENLTDEEIEMLRADINTISADRLLMAQTAGDIAQERISLKVAKRDNDPEAHKVALNNIISIQNTRIANLNKIISDLNKIPGF